MTRLHRLFVIVGACELDIAAFAEPVDDAVRGAQAYAAESCNVLFAVNPRLVR